MGNEKDIRLPWPGWTIGKYLGAGGYGKVYEIERTLSGVRERAALKVVSRPADDAEIEACYENGYDQASMKASYEEEIQRYVKEYELMKDLQGQTNIVSCDDFAVVPRKDGIGGQIFIRMELLTPLQKATMPTKQSMLSESEVIRLGKDICKALILCEARHIIHRDIKPENILISKFGDYKLGDFGVARVQDHTTNATKMGTHGYAAPEVEHGQKYGKEADIYSLGITLYWLLNNRRMPFLNADEPVTTMKCQEALRRRYEGEKLPAPKNGSQKLKRIVLKACAYRPADRYRSAQELYDALAELSGEQTDTASYAIPDCPVYYRKRVASGKAGHAAASAGAASGGSDFDDLFAAMNGEQSGTGTFSSGSKNATDTSFGAGYSGKTEGNGWDDATNATIGKPKSKKTSGASAGTSGTVSRQAQATIDKTMGKTAAYQKQKKQTAGKVVAEEKKEKNGAEFFILVYGVTSVLVLFCAFMSSIDDVTRLSSVARNTHQEFLYRKGLYEVGVSVFVWLGLALAIAFVKTWKASKSIRIIGPVLQIHAILTAIIMLSEDLYTRKIGKEFLESYTIGDTIGIVILSAICIYFFGGVAYLIWELLKAE